MILINRPPFLPFMDPKLSRLPGVVPLPDTDWIATPEDLKAQLRYRDQLIEERPGDVLAVLPEGRDASAEVLEMLLGHLAAHSMWRLRGDDAVRPDGVTVTVDRSQPMRTVGRLISEDICLLAKPDGGDEYRLVAAALCFPAGWSLAKKLGQPLTEIHAPVPQYAEGLSKRVNRIFDGIRADQMLLRFNWTLPTHAELYSPPSVREALEARDGETRHYLRTERQTFRRLPQSGAVAFGIRTAISPLDRLRADEAAALLRVVEAQTPEMIAYKDGSAHIGAACDLLRRLEG